MTENKGDLISREALKKALAKNITIWTFNVSYDGILAEVIDNVPTVEDHSRELVQKSLELGRNVGYFEGKTENKRPQGEWIEVEKQGITGDGRVFTYTIVVCSECGEQYDLEGEKFCPHCGADMRGKADQLRDCENCVHHSDNGCEVWECEFEKRSDV